MTDETTATKPAYQPDSVCEPKLSTHGNKGHKKGFRRNITLKISSLMKKFEISHSDHSSCSRNHPKPVVDGETSTDGGKPLLSLNPGTASSHYTPFRRTPSPRPATAEPHPPGCHRSLHPAEQQPGYKTSPCLCRQLPPPAGCTSPKSEKIKQVQSEATRQARVKR